MSEDATKALLAKAEIAELIHTYPRGLDRLDKSILLSIAHVDATIEFAPLFKGTWSDYVEWLMKAHHAMIFNNHRISNVLIRVKGARGVSEATSTATLIAKRSDGNYEDRLVYSRYLDQWRYDGGQWLLAHRLTVRDFRRVSAITEDQLKLYEMNRGGDGASADPSYKLFESLVSG